MGAVTQGPLALGAAIPELADWLRLGAAADEVVLAGVLRAATQMCESFTGQALIARDVSEILAVTGDWQRLSLHPVRAVTRVEGLPAEGAAFDFAVGDYAIDIDALADGFVRIHRQGAAGRMRVQYRAGLCADAGDVPDAIRQGIILYAAHLYAARDSGERTTPPQAITGLWQVWRRVRLS